MVKFNLLAVAVLTSITFSTCTQAEDKSDWPSPMMEMSAWQVMLDRLELSRNTDKENVFTWDATAWYGGDYHRVVLRTEGENQQNDGHPTDQGLGQDFVGFPTTFKKDVHALFDLFLETVIEVVEHLLDKFLVVEFRQDDVFFFRHGAIP